MNPVAFRATLLNILGNAVLFALKLTAGILSGSIALISEALNSLSDVAASIATFVCVKISDKRADEGHPFGHSRAEPIAGLIIAVLAGILGFEVIRASVERLLAAKAPDIGLFAVAVPLITIAAKAAMSLHFKKAGKLINSPALRATAADSFMDVFVAAAALAGILGAKAGYVFLDPAAGLVISLWIIRAGYKIGVENIDYLMGKSPEPALLGEIRKAALDTAGVKAVNTVRAHFVGNFIHVEIHVEVDKNLSTYDSHEIGKKVEKNVEAVKSIEKTFVHIDPA